MGCMPHIPHTPTNLEVGRDGPHADQDPQSSPNYSYRSVSHLPHTLTNLEVGSARSDWFLIRISKLQVAAFTAPCRRGRGRRGREGGESKRQETLHVMRVDASVPGQGADGRSPCTTKLHCMHGGRGAARMGRMGQRIAAAWDVWQ